MKFKLKRGSYATGTIEAGNVQTFKPGAVIESDQNLAAVDPLKFEPYTGQDGGGEGDDPWARPDGMKSAPPAPPRGEGEPPAPAKGPEQGKHEGPKGPGVTHEGHPKSKK